MKKSLFAGCLVLLLIVIVAGSGTTRAATVPVNGFAWSSTIGWIQFDTGSAEPVTIDDVSGNWDGYAWSSNIGWIDFGANSCGPRANVNVTTGQVVGWAKALSADGNGWDGCVELSGLNHASPDPTGNGGVTYIVGTGNFVGFAWGGPVVGWVQFNPTTPTGGAPDVSLDDPIVPPPGSIDGTCTAVSSVPSFTPPNVNVSPGTQVTFQGNPTSGTGPYQYSWSGGAYQLSNQTTLSYPATAPGPTLTIRDATLATTLSISCPNVTVIPPISSSNIQIGRDLTHLLPAGATLNIPQGGALVIAWNATLTDDYTATVTLTDAGGSPVSNPGLAAWNNTSIGNTATNNGDGTITWGGASANTTAANGGTSMTAGTSGAPLAPGVYRFTIVFDNGDGSPQTTTASLRVVQTTEIEI